MNWLSKIEIRNDIPFPHNTLKVNFIIKLEILFHWNRCVAWHCIETCIPSLEWFGPTVTKLCSGQGNPDTADAATADESNPYMSPFKATQKHIND